MSSRSGFGQPPDFHAQVTRTSSLDHLARIESIGRAALALSAMSLDRHRLPAALADHVDHDLRRLA